MARTASKIELVVELDETQGPVDAIALADQVASDLQSDAVDRWVERVRSAVVESRRLTKEAGSSAEHCARRPKPATSQAAAIKRQIAALEEKLAELERAV